MDGKNIDLVEKIEKRRAYRKEWMRKWRENNPEKAKEIQKNYWKRRLEKENDGKENEDGKQ